MLVELVLAEHRAQRGLRELAGRVEVVLDLDDRVLRIDDAEVDHRVDLDRDVVARDHVLGRHVHHDDAQVDAHHLLDAGDEDDQARALDLPEAAELEHHAALVLAQDALNGTDDEQRQQDRDDRNPQRLNPNIMTCSLCQRASSRADFERQPVDAA